MNYLLPTAAYLRFVLQKMLAAPFLAWTFFIGTVSDTSSKV